MADGAHGDTGDFAVRIFSVVHWNRYGKSAGAAAQILLRHVVGRNVPDPTVKKGLTIPYLTGLPYQAQVSHSMATNRHPG